MTWLGLRRAPIEFVALLAVISLAGCPSDDSSEDEGSETAADTASTEASGDGDGDACTPPEGMFGDCRPGTDACMTEGPKLCISDGQDPPGFGVCSRRCTDVCECWAPPADGDAPVACAVIDPSNDPACFLDCSGGQACPTGMVCTDTGMAELCVFQ